MSSDLILIGSSGAKAYRAALATVSENITNASTPNYSRRTLNLQESVASANAAAFTSAAVNFGGVEVRGVVRANDTYLDAAARYSGNVAGSASMRENWLTQVQTALNDSDTGIGQRMTGMFAAGETLAGNPADPTLRQSFLFGIQQTVNAFHQTASDLSNISQGISQQAQTEVSAVNDAITALAQVNIGLRRAAPGSAAEAQLLDSRDAALATISSRLDVKIDFADRGIAQVSYNGETVLDSTVPTSFAVTANADGTLSLTHEGNAVSAPQGGTLGGLFTSANVTTQRIASVDALAQQFATQVNNWNAQGKTPAGTTGGALLSIGTGAASLGMATQNSADIASASTDGTANGNLLTLSNLRGTNGMEDGWTALVGAHGNLLAATIAENKAAQSRDEQARTARENVSGVDLDVEAADLLRYQQAYQGAAKIIQVARETTQSILDIIN